MKLTIRTLGLLFSLCFIVNSGFAQFAKVGSVWHYNIGEGHPFHHFTALESVKDTSFLGFNAKKLCSPICNPIYVAQKQDTVFIFNWDKIEFVKFFYYGGKVGDTLYLGFGRKDSSEYKSVITKVDTIVVNGKEHKTYYTDNQSSIGYSGRFIEGIGYTHQFLPEFVIRPTIFHNGLRCFNWNVVEQRFKDIACDSYDVSVSEKQKGLNNSLKIAPNPTSTNLSIEIANRVNPSFIQLINSIGEVVFQSEVVQPRMEISVEELQSGVYFIQVQTDSGIETEKVVIR
jgi:hypothetical protein